MSQLAQIPLAAQLAVLVIVVMALIAAVTDTRSQRIPNWLTFPPMIVAPIAYGLTEGLSGAANSVAGLFACGAIPYFIFRKGGMAGGDVKFFAAMGAVVGPSVGIEVEFWAVVAAAVISLIRLAMRKKLLRTFGATFYLALNPIMPRRYRRRVSREMMTKTRLGAPIFVGTLLAITLHYLPLAAGSLPAQGSVQ